MKLQPHRSTIFVQSFGNLINNSPELPPFPDDFVCALNWEIHHRGSRPGMECIAQFSSVKYNIQLGPQVLELLYKDKTTDDRHCPGGGGRERERPVYVNGIFPIYIYYWIEYWSPSVNNLLRVQMYYDYFGFFFTLISSSKCYFD